MEFRKATMEDAMLLLDWKNDPDTRRNAIVTEDLILWDNHLKWLQAHLNDEFTELYVIMDTVPIGDIRFDISDEIEVSIRLGRPFRGMGKAKQALRKCDEVQRDHRKNLIAKIVSGNIPSLKLFLAGGFKLAEYIRSRKNFYLLRRVL